MLHDQFIAALKPVRHVRLVELVGTSGAALSAMRSGRPFAVSALTLDRLRRVAALILYKGPIIGETLPIRYSAAERKRLGELRAEFTPHAETDQATAKRRAIAAWEDDGGAAPVRRRYRKPRGKQGKQSSKHPAAATREDHGGAR